MSSVGPFMGSSHHSRMSSASCRMNRHCVFIWKGTLLAERFQISTPDLENVCLLNGIHFHVDDEFGCQMYIEDRPGLIAAVRAATTRNVEKPNFQAITRWRLYRTDDRSVSSL
jgi:hypothetical protein